MDNYTRQTGARDVKENRWESVDSQQDYKCGDDTGKRPRLLLVRVVVSHAVYRLMPSNASSSDLRRRQGCCEPEYLRANTGLRLDGSARERASSWISSKERAENVGHSDGYKFLRRVDSVVVDATERLRDGDMLNEEDNYGGRNIADNQLEDCGVHPGNSSILES